MDPRHGRELAQEEGASNQPTLSRTRVCEVRIPAIEVFPVFLDHGQLPIPLPCPLAGRGNGVIPGLGRAEGAGHLVAQRLAHSPGQGRYVDEMRRPKLLRVAPVSYTHLRAHET